MIGRKRLIVLAIAVVTAGAWTIAYAADALFVNASGNVGVGTSSPSDGDGFAGRYLDVKAATGVSGAGGSARLIVDAGDQGSNFVEFLMQEANVNKWSFGYVSGPEDFYVYNYILNDYAMQIGRDTNNVGIAGCRFSDHDLTIGGTGAGCNTGTFSEIDAGEAQFTVSSSRSIKTNLEPVDPKDVLSTIEKVGVYKYDFIDGPQDKLGLMAEDFHQVFKRGSDKMINGQDVQMALWLAVQELNEKLRDQSEKVQKLEAELNTYRVQTAKADN